jgi:lipopolysaccharide biosynthesis protein
MIKVGIHIHVYHTLKIDEIFNYLSNLPRRCDLKYYLYLSYPRDNSEHVKKRKWRHYIDELKSFNVKNVGYDLYPFIKFCGRTRRINYDIVLKLHTKSDHFGSNILGYNLECILGSPDIIIKIIDAFSQNSNIGIIGSHNSYVSLTKFMYNNQSSVNDLCKLNNLNITRSDGFYAGSLMWINSKLLQDIFFYARIHNFFEQSFSGNDGGFSHAYERCLGLISKKHNLVNFVSNGNAIYTGVPSLEPYTVSCKLI